MKRRFVPADYFIENHQYSRKKLISENIDLLNWNIQKSNNNPLWIIEFKRLIDQFKPEITLLQECQFQNGLEQILHIEHFGFVFAPNFLDHYQNSHSGVLTACTANHLNVAVTHTDAFEPLIKVPKIYLATTYAIDKEARTLLVINIHAINFVSYWKFMAQVQQLKNSICNHNGPMIVAGDFNTWSRKRSNMLDQVLTSCALEKVKFPPQHAKHIKKFLFHLPLDHIYYKGVEVAALPQTLKTKSSDHNPLLVKFKLSL